MDGGKGPFSDRCSFDSDSLPIAPSWVPSYVLWEMANRKRYSQVFKLQAYFVKAHAYEEMEGRKNEKKRLGVSENFFFLIDNHLNPNQHPIRCIFRYPLTPLFGVSILVVSYEAVTMRREREKRDIERRIELKRKIHVLNV